MKILVLAMGDAKTYVPHTFSHYRFINDDGSDIPDKIVGLFEEVQQRMDHRYPSTQGI